MSNSIVTKHILFFCLYSTNIETYNCNIVQYCLNCFHYKKKKTIIRHSTELFQVYLHDSQEHIAY